jgi:hypothetical protein
VQKQNLIKFKILKNTSKYCIIKIEYLRIGEIDQFSECPLINYTKSKLAFDWDIPWDKELCGK